MAPPRGAVPRIAQLGGGEEAPRWHPGAWAAGGSTLARLLRAGDGRGARADAHGATRRGGGQGRMAGSEASARSGRAPPWLGLRRATPHPLGLDPRLRVLLLLLLPHARPRFGA
eukprot:scaffold1722_cov380-Prasinococcus_capsulatus_cf.AAC.14